MPIYLGTSKIKDLFFGTAKIKEIYLGESKIYSSSLIISTDPTDWTKTYSGGSIGVDPETVNGLLYMGGSANGRIYLTEKIDLTNYNTFTFDFIRRYATNAAKVGFKAVTPATGSTWDLAFTTSTATGTYTNCTLDISSLTGEYYLMLSGHSTSGKKFTIYNMILS